MISFHDLLLKGGTSGGTMKNGHSNIKRIVHRCMEELSATGKIAKVTSWGKALTTFRAKLDIQMMTRNGYKEPVKVRKRLVKKHEIMMEYFEKTFGNFVREYDYNRPLPEDDPSLHDRIWVCWWQGIEQAPELVKRCVASIQKNAGNHIVTIITEENYKEYIHLPEWVEKKKEQGIISRTHLSDILRLSLLAEHGGMWLDATFFLAKPSVEEYFSYPLWSIKRPDYLHCSIASGYFADYSLKCNYEKRWIFATIRDFFLHYWETNDQLIDYLTQDYMIVLAQRMDCRIEEEFQKIVPNNPTCDDLHKLLGEQFNATVWEELTADTSLFKLTWKQNFPKQKDGKETFYGKLLDGTL
jgi:hypothetical protein